MKNTYQCVVSSVLCVCVVMMLAGCKLTGTVALSTGEPLQGVTLTLGGDSSGTAITDSAGVYVFDVPNKVASYTITPTLEHYSFTPFSRNVDVDRGDGDTIDGLDFTASLADYVLKGQVTLAQSDNSLEGVTLVLSGGLDAVTTTDATGGYVFYIPKAYADYTITPQKNRYVFTPESIDVHIDASTPIEDSQITGLDFEGIYVVDPEFSDITYYHNCDSDGPALIHKGNDGLRCFFTIDDTDPVNGTPYWKKEVSGLVDRSYAVESYDGNFSIERGRIGFYHYYDYSNTELQTLIQDSFSNISDGWFIVVIDGGVLSTYYGGKRADFQNVVPDKTWYYFEMKFENRVLTLYIDGQPVGVVQAGNDFNLPQLSLRFGYGDDGAMAYDQIMATNDPERSLYDIRDITEF